MKKGNARHLYLFRHGQTTYNRDKRFTGWQNPGLTALGKRQAVALGRKLTGKQFEMAVHTSLRRSKETLTQVIKDHTECVVIRVDDRLRERNYGALNGMTHASFIARRGQKAFDAIHRGFSVRPPRGESFADVEKRVKRFIRDIVRVMKKKKVNVVISAHGNSIRLFRKVMEKASVDKTCAWVIPYDKVFVYSVKV